MRKWTTIIYLNLYLDTLRYDILYFPPQSDFIFRPNLHANTRIIINLNCNTVIVINMRLIQSSLRNYIAMIYRLIIKKLLSSYARGCSMDEMHNSSQLGHSTSGWPLSTLFSSPPTTIKFPICSIRSQIDKWVWVATLI